MACHEKQTSELTVAHHQTMHRIVCALCALKNNGAKYIDISDAADEFCFAAMSAG